MEINGKDVHQRLLDEAHERWNDEDDLDGLKYPEFLSRLDYKHKAAVLLANMNYQVQNGGWQQWYGNGYWKMANELGAVLCHFQEVVSEVDNASVVSEALQIFKTAQSVSEDVIDERFGEPVDDYEWEQWSDALDKLDDRYYKIDDELMRLAEEFCRRLDDKN